MQKRNLVERISAQHLADYLDRRLSTKQIAELYGVKPSYAVRTLPSREPRERPNKMLLRQTRNEYRMLLAKEVDAGRMSAKAMAEVAHCSIVTVFRVLRKVRCV